MSDPGSTYRTRDEIAGIRQERDPIERVRKLILAHDFATAQELKVLFGLLRLQTITKGFLSGHRKEMHHKSTWL
jgi:pyruvate dehydrogenase E1 component alpha subunit